MAAEPEDNQLVPGESWEVSTDFYNLATQNRQKLIFLRIQHNLVGYHQAEALKECMDYELWRPFVNEGDTLAHYLASPEVGINNAQKNKLVRVAKAMEALGVKAKDLEGIAVTKFDKHLIPCLEMRKVTTDEGIVYEVDNRKDAMDLIEDAKLLSWADFEKVTIEYREERARESGALSVKKVIDEGPAFADKKMKNACGYVIYSNVTDSHHTIKVKINNKALEGTGPITIVIPRA